MTKQLWLTTHPKLCVTISIHHHNCDGLVEEIFLWISLHWEGGEIMLWKNGKIWRKNEGATCGQLCRVDGKPTSTTGIPTPPFHQASCRYMRMFRAPITPPGDHQHMTSMLHEAMCTNWKGLVKAYEEKCEMALQLKVFLEINSIVTDCYIYLCWLPPCNCMCDWVVNCGRMYFCLIFHVKGPSVSNISIDSAI